MTAAGRSFRLDEEHRGDNNILPHQSLPTVRFKVAPVPLCSLDHSDVRNISSLGIYVEDLVLDYVGIDHQIIDIQNRCAAHIPQAELLSGLARLINPWRAVFFFELGDRPRALLFQKAFDSWSFRFRAGPG